MNPRVFTSLVETYHLQWLESTLQPAGINQHNQDVGIDLTGPGVGIELKSRLQKYSPNFAVHAYQIDTYPALLPNHTLYWAFLVYDLQKPIDAIQPEEIPTVITNREVWFLDWNWIRQFPTSNAKTGPYVYVHKNQFPLSDHFSTMEENGGILHIPRNSLLEEKLNPPF